MTPRLVIERGLPGKVTMYEVTAEAMLEAIKAGRPFDVVKADLAASFILVALNSLVYEAGRLSPPRYATKPRGISGTDRKRA